MAQIKSIDRTLYCLVVSIEPSSGGLLNKLC